jgi:hypothetical protein
MAHSLAVWIDDIDETKRRQAFQDLVSSYPFSSTSTQRSSVRTGTFLESQHGRAQEDYCDMNAISNSVRTFMNRQPDSNRLFTLTTWWRPGDIEATAPLLGQRDAPITFTYFGSMVRTMEWKSRTISLEIDPRWREGDLNIEFADELIDTYDGTESGGQLSGPRVMLKRIDPFVVWAIDRLRPVDAILSRAQGGAGRGGVVASEIFHRNPVEFLRDVGRELFLMESNLEEWDSIVLAGRLESDLPRGRLVYHADALQNVEELLTADRLAGLYARCSRILETLDKTDSGRFGGKRCAVPAILDLAQSGSLLRQSIERAQPKDVCDVLSGCENVTLTDTGYGYLLKHLQDPQVSQSVYEHLALAIQGKRFLG